MAGINSIIVQALIGRLKATMQTPFAVDDETRLNEIGVGKLQSNPNSVGVFIMVRPSTDAQRHEAANNSYVQNMPLSLIGSRTPASFYRRRYTLEVGMFFAGSDDDIDKDGFWESMEKADTILGRLKHAIATMPIPNDVSDFGEAAVYPPVVVSEFAEESGSKRGKNNFRGDVIVDFFTQFTPI